MSKRKKSKHHNLKPIYYLTFLKPQQKGMTRILIFSWKYWRDETRYLGEFNLSEEQWDHLHSQYKFCNADYCYQQKLFCKTGNIYYWADMPFIKRPKGVRHQSHTIWDYYMHPRNGHHKSAVEQHYWFNHSINDYQNIVPKRLWRHTCRHHDEVCGWFDDDNYVRQRKSSGWKESTKCRHQYLIHV